MSKSIETLPEDIYELLDSSLEHGHSAELAAEYAMRIGGEFAKATMLRNKPRERGSLWASDIGKPCMRYHYYNFNEPDKGEKLLGHTKFKFLYGSILEEAALYFGEESGHRVHEAQSTVQALVGEWQVRGRIDCVVDGAIADVKSASVYSFNKYRKEGVTSGNDSFGYLFQLGFYKHFNDLESVTSDGAYFIFIDKQNGHIAVIDSTDEIPTKEDILSRVEDIIKAAEADSDEDLDHYYKPEPYGKSGNMALGIGCSYCSFKEHCWRDSNGGRGLRGFAYNHKPVWFTEVAREPKVPELTGDSDE